MILLTVILFTYFKTSIKIQNDVEVHPIQIYIEECVNKAAVDAVLLVGQQGGYIDIPLNIRHNPSRYLNPDGLDIIKMPLWFYKGNKYNPGVGTVQLQISKYIKEHTKTCINNFEAFDKLYNIRELDEMTLQTFLNKEDILVRGDFPLDVRTNSSRIRISEFSTVIPVRLRKTLSIATKILDYELRSVFLENFTLDLMTSNPDIPFTDMKFTCNKLEWNIPELKSEVEEMLKINLPRIRIKNTAYIPFQEPQKNYENLLNYRMKDIWEGNIPEDVPEDAYEYLHMFYDIDIEKDNRMSIGFDLSPVGIDLIARPHDNGILNSRVAQGSRQYLKFLCVNIYHFLYDVNFPVRVSVKDDQSFNGKGYFFNFALPVTIHNNEPYKVNYAQDLFTTTYFDRGFCEDKTSQPVDIRALGFDAGVSNIELDDVNISLECFKYYCDLGKTKPDFGSYRLLTELPNCANPYIIAEKEGYLKSKEQLDGDRINLILTKLKELDFKVVYHRYNSIGNIIEQANELADDMNVSIQLITDDLTQYKIFPGENNIELIQGKAEYDIDIVLTQDGEYIGGYKAKWSPKDITTANEVVFHVIQYVPVPLAKEDKLKMMGYILDGDYKNTLQPEIK